MTAGVGTFPRHHQAFREFTTKRPTRSSRTEKTFDRALKELSIDVHTIKIRLKISELYLIKRRDLHHFGVQTHDSHRKIQMIVKLSAGT